MGEGRKLVYLKKKKFSFIFVLSLFELFRFVLFCFALLFFKVNLGTCDKA